MAAKYLGYKHLAKADGVGPGPTPPSDAVREHPIVSGQMHVGLISADHPRFPVSTNGGHAAMKTELQNAGYKFEETDGCYGMPEKSFIVYNIPREHLFDLGNRYGQEATVFCQQGGHREMLYTNGERMGRAHPGLPSYEYWHKDPPEDYYTRIPATGGFLRLKFDDDNLIDTPLTPLVGHRPAQVQTVNQGTNDNASMSKNVGDLREGLIRVLKKALGGHPSHPHGYDWHDHHTDHHHKVICSGGILVRTKIAKHDGVSVPPPPSEETHQHPTNDQVAVKGVPSYAKYAAPYGNVNPAQKADLRHYPLDGKLQQVQQLVKDHGYSVFYAGGRFGRPDLHARNYNTGHLMIYDPAPEAGGTSGHEDHTNAWRQLHELAHALTYQDVNNIYGEGRRIGKLGVHRTQREAMRAVHWEWLAAHKQRELSAQIGVHIPDDVFHRELNTVMHDAIHRAVTGRFTEPVDEGFQPFAHKVPLEHALGMVREAAHNLGLEGMDHLLAKSERREAVSEKTYSIPEVRERLAKAIKARVESYSEELRQLRVRELKKSAGTESCVLCQKSECACFNSLKKNASCGSTMAPNPVAKDELDKCGETLPTKKGELCPHCGSKTCKCPGVTPDDKKSKDATPKKSGHGGIPGRGKKLNKAAVPSSTPPKPPSSKAGSPSVGASMAKSEDKLAKSRPMPGTAPAVSPVKGSAMPDVWEGAAPAAKPTIPGKSAAGIRGAPMTGGARGSIPAPKAAPDFTAASANTPAPQGAAAGAMKPPAAPAVPPPGTAGLKPPSAGVQAQPQGSKLARFTAALKGQKPAAPAMKSESEENSLAKSLGACPLCGKGEHPGDCQ